MKRKLLLPLLLMSSLFLFTTACDSNKNENNNTGGGQTEIVTQALATPTISLDGEVVSWNAVSNATSYVVNLNGNDLASQTGTSYTIQAYDYGDYTVKVKALSTNELYTASEYSSTVTLRVYDKILDAPVIEEGENNTITWASVAKATKYIVNINGVDKDPVTENSYSIDDLTTGIYKIKVKAACDTASIGSSEYSNELTVDHSYERALETPSISLNSKYLTWDSVENATSYDVLIDDQVVATKTDVYSYLVPYAAGEHTIKVQAKSTDTKYKASTSKVLTYKTDINGFIEDTTGDFTKYENTDAYVKVTSASELLAAITNAQYDYTNVLGEMLENRGYVVRNNVRKNESNWKNALAKGLYLKNDDGTYYKIPADTPFSDTSYTASMTYYEDSNHSRVSYTQTLNQAGSVHVIEIMNDIELGWDKLSESDQALAITADFSAKSLANETSYTMSSMYKEYGMTQVTISKAYNLLIYSKNGSKITHGGFKVNNCNNICFRNLEFDEMWQWEDTASTSVSAVGDMDAFGWAYFKINYCDEVWIDHCKFGKAYDGIIDVANPTYDSVGTYTNAPYNADGSCSVSFTYCDFAAGSDDKDGYLYKMMAEIEADYQAKKNTGNNNYLYYKALRDGGLSFDEILYGIAIPQKKAFLICDGTDENYSENKDYNQNMNLSILYCKFTDIEDRIPKVRSGSAYIYGSVIDASRYYGYRTILKNKNAKDIVSAVNSTWKCGGVSQCMIASQDGSIYAEGCIFKGIAELVKNNDYGKGGIIIYNSRYVVDSIDYTGSTYDENHKFSITSAISPEYFFWTTAESIPFMLPDVNLTTLEATLATSAGIQSSFTNGLTNM